MDKEILLHKQFVQTEIARIAKIPENEKRAKAAKTLMKFHASRVRDFEAERLIHLLVTLFFAVLMFASWFGLAAVYLKFAGENSLLICGGLIVAILTIMEIFYIRYYYHLENRTQNLYNLTREIYKMM